MSYAISEALQTAVYNALSTDAELGMLVGASIFDAEPAGAVPPLYVAIGPETVKTRSDASGAGALHEFTLSVVSDTAGFAVAKRVAGRITDILIDADMNLARGRLVTCRFYKARAARVQNGGGRRVDLTFRAIVDDA
ncbi:DUF3168 domain-containing protein [Litoreibacter roseus]|uniref:DUF3168 domain-containing protein n=1 Tax=Litoreibacter roseus TaxID=2601869 RepID=A0A6N6JL82_9RHOB|nr:DUF3168 domain-containing protein [Litoreibacter roseus]GFE66707.1 hypothetical protein KIN_37810 [Litoreibacter roseus]